MSPSSPYLPEQGLEVLDGGRLERLEAVALVDARDHVDDELTPPDVVREEVAHPARGLGGGHGFGYRLVGYRLAASRPPVFHASVSVVR